VANVDGPTDGAKSAVGRDFPANTKSVLDEFERLGFGRWALDAVDAVDIESASRLGQPVVPVAASDGTVIAVLRAVDRPAVDAANLHEVEAMASLLALILESERRAEEATHRAEVAEAESATDAMTGLANARGWWDAVRREAARCERQGLRAVLVIVDLDDLKQVNDREGHLAGDVLIRVAARTLQDSVRATDVVARLGGDEFAVLAVDHDGSDPPNAILERIRTALAAADVAASVGGAVHPPGAPVEDTFHVADLAMYEAKRRRRR